MTTKTETVHAGGFLVSELPGLMSRIKATLNSGQNLGAGTVLGRILSAAAAVAGTNTGTGAVTVGAAIGAATVPGIYKLLCVAAAANAGTFNFYAPDGTLIRQITVAGGAHVSDHLTITIADATDFVVGDSFTIAVTEGDYEILTPASTTGQQIAAAILFAAVDATSADTPCALITNNAALNSGEITWPAGISAGNKAIATAQLAARGIVLR